MNLTQLTIVGTVVTDPEHRTLNGVSRLRLRVACTTRQIDPQTGRWREGDTTYLTCIGWRRLADGARTLTKGTRVIVVGQLRQYDYARDTGREIGYELLAQDIAVCVPSSPPAGSPTTTPAPPKALRMTRPTPAAYAKPTPTAASPTAR